MKLWEKGIGSSTTADSDTELKDSINRTISRAVLAIDLLILCAVSVATLYYLPQFIDVFKQIGGELPALTRVVVSIPSLFYAAALVVIAGALIAKERLIENAALRLQINIWSGLMLLGVSAILVHAMFLPLLNILHVVQRR